MTVRDVGGCLIDFAFNEYASDQLSAFYPHRKKFPFRTAKLVDDGWVVTSVGNQERPQVEVRYHLSKTAPMIHITSTFVNTTQNEWVPVLEDDLRIDSGNEDIQKSANRDDLRFVSVDDRFWQQAYVVFAPGYQIRSISDARVSFVTYLPLEGELAPLMPGEKFTFERSIIVHRHLPGALAEWDRMNQVRLVDCEVTVHDSKAQPIIHAKVEIETGAGSRGAVATDEMGRARFLLPEGSAEFRVTHAGVEVVQATSCTVADSTSKLKLKSDKYAYGSVEAQITDQNKAPIPAKVEFIGHNETPTPDWGPDSADYFVRNLAYSASGSFETSLAAGEYNVIVSHGPEFDAKFTRIKVMPGELSELNVQLDQVVNTTGWVSADFHSHSSPSGDNTEVNWVGSSTSLLSISSLLHVLSITGSVLTTKKYNCWTWRRFWRLKQVWNLPAVPCP